MKKTIFAVAAFSVIISISVKASEQMAIWDFGQSSAYYTEAPTAENVIGTPTLAILGGQKDVDGKNGVAYVDIAGVSHIAGQTGAWDDVKVDGPDASWIVTMNTTGWQNIAVRFDYKAWDPTTTSFDLDYRLGETDDWIEILNNEPITADKAFHSFSYTFAGDIANQAFVQFRFYDLDENGNKEFAFDNLEFSGAQIPEPATILLLGLGVSAILRKRVK